MNHTHIMSRLRKYYSEPCNHKDSLKLTVAQNEDNVALNQDNVALNLDKRIIQIIKSNPKAKREDIANQLSVSKKTIERHLKILGIRWEGHSKTGQWII